jgi:hypothetical protein
VDWQALEAVSTAAAAGGAIVAAFFAYRAIEANRSFNRTRLTVDLFETAMTQRFTRNVNLLMASHPTLTLGRAFMQLRLSNPAAIPQQEREMYLDLLGIMGYGGEIYAEKALNRKLFLARACEFIAIAFYLLEPAIKEGLRTGLLRRNVVTLARDCLEYRNRIPRAFDDKPELQTYRIPSNFGS